MGEEEEKEEEKQGEDQRREEAIASTQCLQPNFKPTRVTQDQLSKLQELHMRRLKMKSKMHKKTKGGSGKLLGNNSKHLGAENHDSSTVPCISNVKGPSEDINISLRNDNGVAQNVPKKRQKLHWGLDTKERWERKANM